MTEQEQTVPYTLQIPVELFEQIKRMAIHDLCPVKEELIVLLQEAVDRRKRDT
jgi:hypothetical protein